MRLDHDLVVAPVHRHQRVIADQFGGENLAADGAFGRGGDAAVLRPDPGDGLCDLTLHLCFHLRPVGEEVRPFEAAMDDVHRR